MKLNKNHWLLYNYNYIFNKQPTKTNNNFCDLFWGGFVIFFITLPLHWVSYTSGKIRYRNKKIIEIRETVNWITMNFTRWLIHMIVYMITFLWYQHILNEGWLYGGLYTGLTALGICVGIFVFLSGVLFMSHKIADWLDDRHMEPKEKSPNVIVQGWKSIKEKYCPIVEFED